MTHIRIFGCPAFVHVPKDKRKKLESRTRKCMFVGYVHNTNKIWRVWDPVSRRCLNAANVIFDEACMLHAAPKPAELAEERTEELDAMEDLRSSQLLKPIKEAESSQVVDRLECSGTMADMPSTSGANMPSVADMPSRPRIQLGEEIIDDPPTASAAATRIGKHLTICAATAHEIDGEVIDLLCCYARRYDT